MEAKIFKSLMHIKTNELDDFQDWSFVSGIQSWLHIKINETSTAWHFVAVEEYMGIYFICTANCHFIKYYVEVGRYYTNHILKFIILYWDFQYLEELMWYGVLSSMQVRRYYTKHVLKFIILYIDFQKLEKTLWLST